MSSLKKKR